MACWDDDLLELAAAQHGVLARWQLRRTLTADAVDGRVRRGDLEVRAPGIYAFPATARPEQAPVVAALRSRGSGLLTGPFVLAHHRIDGFEPDAPFEVLLPPGRRALRDGAPYRVCRRTDREHQQLGEVRLATAVDALLDSARFRSELGDRALRLARDQLGWRGLARTPAIEERIAQRGTGDPAVRAFLAAMDGDELRAESDGERKVGRHLRRLDPAPQPQVWVTPRYRLDWYLRPLRLGWEFQGRLDHAGARLRRADQTRDEELGRAGIRLLYVTEQDLASPSAFVATMMGAVAARADELGVEVPRLRPA